MFLVFSFYVFEIILVELEYSLFWGKINLFKFEENWRKKKYFVLCIYGFMNVCCSVDFDNVRGIK